MFVTNLADVIRTVKDKTNISGCEPPEGLNVKTEMLIVTCGVSWTQMWSGALKRSNISVHKIGKTS